MSVKYFDLYVKLGLEPIALYKNSKIPISKKWNEKWSIQKWRPYFEMDDYNMGILLGEVVDIEGDTQEANDFLLEITKGFDHPMYKSSKSIHHLFKNPDPHLTKKCYNGIEFRAYKHQSVIPPSKHKDGSCYLWCREAKFPVPEMPDKLYDFYCKHLGFGTKNKNKKLKKDFTYTICRGCDNKLRMNKTRLKLEVKAFQQIKSLWLCRKCRSHDIRELCRFIRHSR